MKNLFFIFLIIHIGFVNSQAVLEFSEIDIYARSAPKNIQTSNELVSYFSKKSFTPIEKTRLIYVWLAENISYDDRAYNSKNIGDNSATSVFKSKKAVCAGFANLYTEIGIKMGLDIVTISGVAKGYEFEEYLSDNLNESINHAWNLIRIDNEWRVFDATWGEGFGSANKKGKLESSKKFDNTWFNVDPKDAIFSHLPDDLNKQYINPPISFESFLAMPFLVPSVFETGWISSDELLLKMKDKKRIDLPDLTSPLEKLKLTAPVERVLKRGKSNEFIVESTEVRKVFLYVNEEDAIPFTIDGTKFKYTLNTKTPGTYQVVISNQNDQLYTILEYVIE